MQDHLNQVLRWAIEKEYRTTNPANHTSVTISLGKQPPAEHYQSAPYADLGHYLAQVRDSKYAWAPKYCLMFLAFTEDRGGEALEAVWSDINWDAKTMTIPAHRMKSGIEHVVPLPAPAMEILHLGLEQTASFQRLHFPTPTKQQIPKLWHAEQNPTRNGTTFRAPRPPQQFQRLGHRKTS